jgi:hypothetical protein
VTLVARYGIAHAGVMRKGCTGMRSTRKAVFIPTHASMDARLVQEGGYGYTGCMCLCRRIQAELPEAGIQLNARDSQTSCCLGLVSTRLVHDPLDRLALEQMQIGRLGRSRALQRGVPPRTPAG